MPYSVLKPLTSEEQKNLALLLCTFFSPMSNSKLKSELEIATTPGSITPLSLGDFYRWCKVKDIHPEPYAYMYQIRSMVLKLVQAGILVFAGSNGKSPEMGNCYYSMLELTSLAKKGNLWLGNALGGSFIAHEIRKDIVLIIGKNSLGDENVGTGAIVAPGIILTCAHVITDMTVEKIVVDSGTEYTIRECLPHDSIDVGFIVLDDTSLCPSLPDIGFRDSIILEEVVIGGYPSIPRGSKPVFTVNKGEICGSFQTYHKLDFDVFSAIARPGNSGSPVVSKDGRIVGIVTQSLERQKELIDKIEVMPFFVSVPASSIKTVWNSLLPTIEIPWENYD